MNIGTAAKNTLYERGSRILNFVRYPTLASNKEIFSDFVVSNVDFGATIFDIAGIDLDWLQNTLGYTLDGKSWANAILNNNNTNFEYRFIEAYQSRAVVTTKYKYIWRATETYSFDSYYPYQSNTNQLYDLTNDTDEQTTIYNDSDYKSDLLFLQRALISHLNDTCPLTPDSCKTVVNPCDHYLSNATRGTGCPDTRNFPSFDPTIYPTSPTSHPTFFPSNSPAQFPSTIPTTPFSPTTRSIPTTFPNIPPTASPISVPTISFLTDEPTAFSNYSMSATHPVERGCVI